MGTVVAVTVSESASMACDVSSINCAFEEMGRNERHFNTLQSEYRKLASGWLIAALGAMGYVLLRHHPDELSDELMISLMFYIGIGTSVGVCVLWILDYFVYQRLLEGVFNSAEILEQQFPYFGKAHASVKECMPSKRVSISILIYYVVVASAPSVGSIMLVGASIGMLRAIFLLTVPGLMVVIGAVWIVWFKDRKKKNEKKGVRDNFVDKEQGQEKFSCASQS
jgi:hypothetical protein